MSLISQLREATTIAEADPILKKLRAIGPVRKLVEASILHRMNPNHSSKEYGMTLLSEAIRYLDKEEEPAEPESPGLKRKGDHFVKEEELANRNTGQRNDGSEQSTRNTGEYPQMGSMDGDEDILNAPDTENQMGETEGDEEDRRRESHEDHREREEEAPFPSVMGRDREMIHPDIAKKMGREMPKIKPMDSEDQIKQMHYTAETIMRRYHEKVVRPLLKQNKTQREAIRKLSTQIKETQAQTGNMGFDLDHMQQHAIVKPYQETISNRPTLEELVSSKYNSQKQSLSEIRTEMVQYNNMLNSS